MLKAVAGGSGSGNSNAGLTTTDAGNSSGPFTLNFQTSTDMLLYVATGNITITLDGAPTTGARALYIRHAQDATGTRTLTFNAAGGMPTIMYAGGSPPDYSGRAGDIVDVVCVWCDGTYLIVSPGITEAS